MAKDEQFAGIFICLWLIQITLYCDKLSWGWMTVVKFVTSFMLLHNASVHI